MSTKQLLRIHRVGEHAPEFEAGHDFLDRFDIGREGLQGRLRRLRRGRDRTAPGVSARLLSRCSRVRTTYSSVLRSRPRSWARFASFQSSVSSACLATSFRRACLPSKSKIPPELCGSVGEIQKLIVDGVECFRFHGQAPFSAAVSDGPRKAAQYSAVMSFGQALRGLCTFCLSGGFPLLHRKLKGTGTVVLVDCEAIHRADRAWQDFRAREQHRLEASRAAAEAQLEMAISHDALLEHDEFVVEKAARETLVPRSPLRGGQQARRSHPPARGCRRFRRSAPGPPVSRAAVPRIRTRLRTPRVAPQRWRGLPPRHDRRTEGSIRDGVSRPGRAHRADAAPESSGPEPFSSPVPPRANAITGRCRRSLMREASRPTTPWCQPASNSASAKRPSGAMRSNAA